MSKIDKMMNAMSISLHRNSSSRSKVGLVQLDGRSRSFALNVCAAVVFCVGADMAVVAGARRASEYGTVDDSRPLSKTLLLTQPVLQSANFVTDRIISTSGGAGRTADRAIATSPAGRGSIVGVVSNERHEPVARATVQAFAALATAPQPHGRQNMPPLMRASGSASTDGEGRFRLSGLEPGEYLVAAEPGSLLSGGWSKQTAIYAATFYPSAVDGHQAVPVTVSARVETTVLIELVRVRGVRVSGSVVNPSGGPTGGMSVRLFHRFGGFGSASNVAVVSPTGTFEIVGVPPGWYRLSIEPRSPESKDARSEYAEKVIEVQDRDLDDLSLVFSRGATITGRVVAEAGASVSTGIGVLRVSAEPTPDQFSAMSSFIAATVGENGSFRMSGPAGRYQFRVRADRPPFLVAKRINIDGLEGSLISGVELVDGEHEVVLYIAPPELPEPTAEKALSPEALVEQFKSEKTFWRQITTAKKIVERHDPRVLLALADWLNREDRHVRGNVAFIFAGFGDARGLQVIADILTDRSDRPEGQGMAMAPGDGRYHVASQIAADRYYAAHLLGDLRNPAAVPILIPLLQDKEVNDIVPWALGEIGDNRAVGPLLAALDDANPSIRVLAIYALETLDAKDALPRLTALLNDHEKSRFGNQVSVADAARAAIAKLR